MNIPLLAAIAGAGALGSLSRHLVSQWVVSFCGAFPLHTLVTNLLGCVLFGVAFGLGHGRWPAAVSTAVLVGFFGGFTTFSSFAFDCVQLCEARRFAAAAADVVAHNLLGITGLWLGAAAGRWLAGA